MGTGRVLPAAKKPTGFCFTGRWLERRHLTQTGDRDDDSSRESADCGYLSGDSTPLLIAKDRRTGVVFAAAVSVKGGGAPLAARQLAKCIDGLGCSEATFKTAPENRRPREYDQCWLLWKKLHLLVVPPARVSWRGRCTMVLGGRWRLSGRKFGTPLAGFGERVWLREPPREKVNKFTQDASRPGGSGSASAHVATSWWTLTAGFAVSDPSPRISHRGQVDGTAKPVPPLSVWRGRGCWSSLQQVQITSPEEAVSEAKGFSFSHWTSVTALVVGRSPVVAVHSGTLKSAEFGRRES